MAIRPVVAALIAGVALPVFSSGDLHASVPSPSARSRAAAQAPVAELTAPRRVKPTRATLEPFRERDHVRVKFVDGLVVRERGGRLTDMGTGSLAEAADVLERFATGTWSRAHTLDEERVTQLRERARANLGRHVADLNLQFDFTLPAGVTAEEAIDAFNALACVELADAAPRPAPSPIPPDLTGNQKYALASPTGVNSLLAAAFAGGTGAGVKVCDIEYSFNASHVDLPPVTVLGATVVDPFNTPQHGTAVMGVMGALANGFGTTGLAHGASYYFAGANTTNGYHIDAAILAAVAVFSPGDVIVIEQQTFGPSNVLVPTEWDLPVYNAIVTAVGNGIVVVQAGANSGQDLDSPTFSTGNGGHWPFLPQNDSGSIIVGGGASPVGTFVDRSRLSFSNYGSTVDLQGWGEFVTTTGFGPAYSAEGANAYYTNAFNGTSAATPIVAAACIQLQAAHKARFGTPLSPAALKNVLRATGAPQRDGATPATQQIGPRPDVAAAMQALGLGASSTTCAGDGRGVACPCGNDSIALSGRGCKNSLGLGASLVTTGVASLANDTLRLVTTGVAPTATLLFLQGSTLDNGGSGTVFGDGLRCAGGAVTRLGLAEAGVQGDIAYPTGSQTSVSLRASLTTPGVRHYQVMYRDNPAFCTGDTFGTTNGVSVTWTP